jgi:hypothetical protein
MPPAYRPLDSRGYQDLARRGLLRCSSIASPRLSQESDLSVRNVLSTGDSGSNISDHRCAEFLLRLVAVVRATTQLQVVDGRRSSFRIRDHVMELET